MDLRCYINGKEYNVVQGATFSEEYNETLDSGTIILDNVERIEDLNPYDDVFVYDNDSNPFKGYTPKAEYRLMSIDSKTDLTEKKLYFKKEDLDEIIDASYGMPMEKMQHIELFKVLDTIGDPIPTYARGFYLSLDNKIHLTFLLALDEITVTLAQDAIETDYYSFYFGDLLNGYLYAGNCVMKVNMMYNPKPEFYKHLLVYQFSEERLNPTGDLYKYKIELCSETKKLEKIQLPNISITQPLNNENKRSVYDYAKQYVDLYNVQFKLATSNSSWVYQKKYQLDSSIEEIFKDVYCPDLSLDNPSLRDVLQQLFLTKDRIPYVKDDVIYSLDISATNGEFDTNGVYSIYGSKTLENYDTSLKRTYSNALSGTNTAKRVEYLGFRNSDNTLMTIGNMRVETKYPIYKINKFYMCYYKKASIYKLENGKQVYSRDMVFLCKQDITDLVKLEEERQVLSEDWTDFNENVPSGANCIEEMAKYKLCTVGYSIGGNVISGWGTMYKYPRYWWDVSKSYLENIFTIVDKNLPYGIYTYGYISKSLKEGEFMSTTSPSNQLDNLITPFSGASRLKSFFFEVDYEAFYNGTIITSKDVDKDDIVANDNSSTSLTLLEKDGLFQKEKANRFGNMGYSIRANYKSINEVQKLGSIYEDDVIIYSREIQIWNNIIKASYQGTKDYVLKNYYTSVFSKIRPFALMNYNQSITRAENRKVYILLSKKNLYFEMPNYAKIAETIFSLNSFSVKQDYPVDFFEFSDGTHIDEIISFAEPSEQLKSIDRYEFNDKINYGYIVYNNAKYVADVNTFVSGYSLCFNVAMTDNISMGNYIKVASPEMNSVITSADDDYTGSVQDFYPVVDSQKTGFTNEMGFYVSNVPVEEDFYDFVMEKYSGIENDLYKNIFALPKLESDLENEKNIIGKEMEICKDNKEVIDMTYQIEAYTNDSDIFFSEWMLKLSDLNGVYNKVSQNYVVKDVSTYGSSIDIYYGNMQPRNSNKYEPVVLLRILKTAFSSLKENQNVSGTHTWNKKGTITPDIWFDDYTVSLDLTFNRFILVSSTTIGIESYFVKKIKNGIFGKEKKYAGINQYYLTAITSLGNLELDNENYYYFANINWQGGSIGYMPNVGSNFELMNCTDGNKILYDANVNWNYFSEDALLVSVEEGQSKLYEQNIYVLTSQYEIKKSLVYETKTGLERVYGGKIEEVITTEILINEKEPTVYSPIAIKINLSKLSYTSDKSVQVWFANENAFHFVFGVNLTDEDWAKGYVLVYLSELSRKDKRVYGLNRLPVGEIANYASEDNEFVYGARQQYVLK